ncbi:amino acid adenylation domain-containing protein [Actinomadura sp. 9N215]|uniref:amino acid adenylation domain-containing protein n=1 Tax=Actinomadura sp. 9N215 TaxID=3375150 RepID=UPI0037AAAFE4
MTATCGAETAPTRPAPACETPVTVTIDRVARRTPDAIAVDGTARALTYAELARRVDALARHLTELGVRPEQRVGLMLRHRPGLLVAMLAVLKAGGAYVPLDPDYPAERLAHIAADAEITLMIADDAVRDRVPPGVERIESVDVEGAGVEGVGVEGVGVEGVDPASGRARPRPAPHPAQLAAVIYTSGSSGRPKGALVTHRGLANLAAAAGEEFRLGAGDRFLMSASASFSASLEELFPPLTRGATAVFPPDRAALSSISELLGTIAAHRVSHVIVQTALWDVLVRHLAGTGRPAPESLRMVGMSGERCTPGAYALWRRLGLPLVHVYGPTETTATATYCTIPPADASRYERPPIGGAIAGTRLYVADERMSLVPDGEPGELYVGGDSVVRGYLGRPDLTAERFGPDPFSGLPGEVLYRTGDLVRRRADGRLEFLGRTDDQVKIRGYRVEPAEVEAAIEEHDHVSRAVVTAPETPDGRRLVGYVEAAPGTVTAPELRRFLAGRLPSYLVPSAIVRMDALPLTAHRKVDRAALPAPGRARPPLDQPYAAPDGPDEERLCAIWADLLGLDRVGATDDFLALGGDSLLVTRMLLAVEAAFGVRLTPRAVFEARTVRRVAVTVRDAAARDLPDGTAALRRERLLAGAALTEAAGRPVIGPVSPAQQGMWLLSLLLAGSPANNSPWQCRLRGPLDAAALRRAAVELVRRNEVLGSAFPELDGRPVQVACEAEVPEWHEVDLRSLPDPAGRAGRARELAAAWGCRPFDVAAGPLLRFLLVRLADDDHLLVCNVHHLVFDVRSLDLLLGELGALYRDPYAGRDAHRPQYADLSVRYQSARRPADLDDGMRYWTSRLAGVRPLAIPDGSGGLPSAGEYDGAVHDFWLPPELFDQVREFARTRGASPYMVLLTAYVAWLHRWSGERDIAVATPMAGRTVPAAADVIGLFIVTAVLRAGVGGHDSFGTLLARVREDALDAYAHQDVPLDEVMERLGAGPLRRNPFRILFALQRDPSADIAWPGIRLGPVDDIPTGTAKFDLSLIFIERADGVAGRVEYRTSALGRAAAARVAEEYCAVLSASLASPETALDDLDPPPGPAVRPRTLGPDAAEEADEEEARRR